MPVLEPTVHSSSLRTIQLPHLDGGYNIFAQVSSGQEIVVAIGDEERSAGDRPVDKVVLKRWRLSA